MKPAPHVITVRLSGPLHAALRVLGFESRQSMNQLCVELFEQAVAHNEQAALTLDMGRVNEKHEGYARTRKEPV